MASCTDFKEEKSAMEVLFEQLSTRGQNLYKIPLWASWRGHWVLLGTCKEEVPQFPLEEKKGKENFSRLVRECIEFVQRENVIRFSAKCRRYMLAYLNAPAERLTYDKIEEFQRKCKTQRKALLLASGESWLIVDAGRWMKISNYVRIVD